MKKTKLSSKVLHTKLQLMFLVLMLSLGVSDAYAHHSHASLNPDDIRTNEGTVVRYIWRMPHVYMVINAPNKDGELVDYTVEMLHPPGMMALGWDKESFKPGDKIIWQGAADKNPNRYYSGILWAEKADGTRLIADTADASLDPGYATGEKSTDFTGLWVRDLRGQPGHYQPPQDWKYTELAQKAVDSFSDLGNPALECHNPGPPKSTLLPYPIKISRPNDDTVIVDYEGREDSRTIYLNGTGPGPGERSKLGYSVGNFDGDVLVVNTDNFVSDRWGTHTGVDSSEQKKLTERFSLIDDGLAIQIQMTIEDPVYLTEPTALDHFVRRIKDRELVDAPCNLENARFFIDATKTE